MKVYTSYFAQIRNMGNGRYPSRYLPISTALWDPKWFHDFRGTNYVFLDKKGVLNGVRCDILSPRECGDSCRGKDKVTGKCLTNDSTNPDKCYFLQRYREQLDGINFNEFMEDLNLTLKSYEDTYNVIDVIPVYMVYETPSNPCSERRAIQEWFKSHGIECSELKF